MIRIRRATEADLPATLEIYNEAVRNTTATYDEAPQTLEERTAWFEGQRARGYPVLIAEEEATGRIVGWSCLRPYHARSGYRFTAENSVYVAADQRGQGIGRLLLAPLIDAGRQCGLHAIIAGIDSESEASLRLHASFGFVEIGHLKEVGFKFGRWLDVIYMELLLE